MNLPSHFRQCRRPHPACGGQGTIEFLLAAVPVLLLGLGGIEAVHWYFARQAVSLALVQAARAAITHQADPLVLDQAFADALLPLYAAPTAAETRDRLRRAMERRAQATALPAWRIHIRSPSSASFDDFASHDPDLPRPAALDVIDNDYLHERHQARLAQGWPEGRGPASRLTTLEANTLALRLTWLHEPLLPGVRNLMRQLAPSDTRYGPLAMRRGGYLPIHREVALVMQSHPVSWPLPAHGRVTRHGGYADPSAIGARRNVAGLPLPAPARPHGGHEAVAGYQAPAEEVAGAGTGTGTAVTRDDGTPYTETGPPRPCAGLWCLDGWVTGSDSAPRTGGGSAPNPGQGPPTAETAGDHGGRNGIEPALPGQGGNGTEHDGQAPPTEPSTLDPDDCPGCCE